MSSHTFTPHPHIYSAVLAFVCVVGAAALALTWAWSSFQHQASAAITPAAMHQAAYDYPRPIASVEIEATESHDAALAQHHLQSAAMIPVSSGAHIAPPAQKNIVPASYPPPGGHPPAGRHKTPRMAIIIDDMGLALHNSHRATLLPGKITLSYLPYADNLQSQVDTAKAKGHEIMLHLPMEALDRSLYAGPGALTTKLSTDELRTKLQANLNAFRGYVGINNHMGSRLTSTPAAMELVMDMIDDRRVYFVDSWTSPRSVAYQTAAAEGIPRARRDVFLDHYPGQAPVWAALKQAEYLARRHGSVVVIGHPKTDTLNVLQAWLPAAAARGVEIVPVSELIYDGPIARDPVLLADQKRRERDANPSSLARIAPASGR